MRQKPTGQIPALVDKIHILRGDKVIWFIIVILMVISLLVVYSSSPKMGVGIKALATTHRLISHMTAIGISIFGLIGAYMVKCEYVRKFTPLIYIASLVATVMVRFTGVVRNGAARWFEIGGISVQPSEFLKLATILLLARNVAMLTNSTESMRLVPSLNPRKWKEPEQQKTIREGFIHIFIPSVVSSMVIALEHTSSGAILLMVSFAIMVIGRIRLTEILRSFLILGVAGALLLTVMSDVGRSDTAGGRISTWVHSWVDPYVDHPVSQFTDTERAQVAIYNGGMIGVGAGQSMVRAKMTHPESDYVFSFFVEEYGLVLAVFLIMMYLWIMARSVTIARQSKWIYSQLLVMGLAMLVVLQAFLHIAVSLNLSPETGQNLPLVSHGGTSMLCTALALGIILSVSRTIESDATISSLTRQARENG